jgi:osmotically-inducible protein OsmY
MHVLEIRDTPVHLDRIEIEEAATECLLKSPYHAVRKVFCQYDYGTLFLRGRLPTFHQKQVAQEAVARVKGVTLVINKIEVD